MNARQASSRLSVNAHPSARLVQMFVWAVVGTGVIVGGTIGYAVLEICTRKWPSPLRGAAPAGEPS